jgi:hypothetical protein
MRSMIVLVCGLVLACASEAGAQMAAWGDVGYLNVNGAFQSGTRNVQTQGSFPLYDETATFDARHGVDSGGIFDISGGVRVWRNLAVGIGITRFGDRSDVDVTGRIPHPLFFDQFRTATVAATGLRHTETGVHIQAVWVQPLVDRVDVALSFGPSFFRVRQDLVGGLGDLQEGAFPFDTVTIRSVGLVTERESAVGVNLGADVTYILSRLTLADLGAGFFVRYAGASVDLAVPGAPTTSLRVGGFQTGAGLRVRF